MVDSGYIASDSDLAAGVLPRNTNIARPPAVDEDDSGLSSSGTEVFDKNSTVSTQPEKWQLDSNGQWQRYHSMESATSTGISSMSSSVAADDALSNNITVASPSRKRTIDGQLKFATQKSFQATSIIGNESSATHTPSPLNSATSGKVPKKRGRPPKPKPLDENGLLIAKVKAPPKEARSVMVVKPEVVVRPRASIPSRLPADVFASQCIEAATSSRLDPYSLHPSEHKLLADLLMSKEVTVYLNVRNAILRLWTQNPLCSVTREEAAGCAKESRFFGIAEVAYRWLIRNGYINFGCVEVPKDPSLPKKMSKDMRQRTVVVVGAGVSGLTTARQLESLFMQEAAKWVEMNERPPRVIVLEGRNRIGGRVYSKPLRSQIEGSLPDGLRNTAEMGAMIVTGFEHGNPLDTVIRGQLGLRYHLMRDALTIYDTDGKPIEEERDMLNTELYTDISDRAGAYRAEAQKQDTLRGDEDLINRCRDPPPDGFTAFTLEPLPDAHIKSHKPSARRGRRRNAPPGTEKLTGRSQVIEGGSAMHSASRAAKDMGWEVRDGVAKNQSVSLHKAAASRTHPTLGHVMDEAIVQYQDLIDLTPTDMRLLNWHHANLEYANAAPVTSLSLSGHDQDTGNEFEGAHSEIVGGYTQLPRGLMNLPTRLDVRFGRVIDSIHYDNGDDTGSPLTTRIVCTDGEVIEADEVVITAPLGVLKTSMIDFDPPLPDWKRGAINRMGFGLLNKVVLLYDAPFWDDERDMFGLLNEAERKGSLNPADYQRKRGRFYLIWNATKISGRPMLVALMAGNAAFDVEQTDTTTLLSEVTERLRSVFTSTKVPAPREVIVTRWKRDPFSRGTYSYVAPETRPGDYDLMARSVGNLHFAGEATCGTHPATVHGAFLSGLRVASEVMDDMAGLISIPNPLVAAAPIKQEQTSEYYPAATSHAEQSSSTTAPSQPHIKLEPGLEPPLHPLQPLVKGPPQKSVCPSDPSFWYNLNSSRTVAASNLSTSTSTSVNETLILATIHARLGDRPLKPARPGVNPFLLFTKSKWEECKAYCAAELANSGRDMIRQTIGKWWKAAGEEEKEPFVKASREAQEIADAARREWEEGGKRWDEEAARVRREVVEELKNEAGGGGGASVKETDNGV
ncbi:unnamed protein product [Zymoseptoria tritici ST99CH_1E4]|nr:unnamed protein product [Zymoseptoria tritici ST99CH_1E4]